MDIVLRFPGGVCVNAEIGSHLVQTDQPLQNGGAGSAPSPFELFLASLATCTGYYVLNFCQRRGLSTEGLRVVQRAEKDPESGMVREVQIDVTLPPGFPEKYTTAVVRAAEQCAVKKHLEQPPVLTINTRAAS
jgi:ribosomal protein S12 methylthiotransferase accessory factor